MINFSDEDKLKKLGVLLGEEAERKSDRSFQNHGPSGNGILIPGVIQAYRLDSGKGNSSYTVSFEDGQFKEYNEDSIIGPGFQSLSRFKLYPGQK
eukprot:g32858.t1